MVVTTPSCSIRSKARTMTFIICPNATRVCRISHWYQDGNLSIVFPPGLDEMVPLNCETPFESWIVVSHVEFRILV